jgi:hypothetical protein
VQAAFEQPVVAWENLIDSSQRSLEALQMTLWDAANELASALREIFARRAAGVLGTYTDASQTRQFHAVRSNGLSSVAQSYSMVLNGLTAVAIHEVSNVKKVGLILLVVEVTSHPGKPSPFLNHHLLLTCTLTLQGCVVGILAMLYVHWLLGHVAWQRYNLFSVFLMMPSGCLRALATKQLHVGQDDEDDDERDLMRGDSLGTKVGNLLLWPLC